MKLFKKYFYYICFISVYITLNHSFVFAELESNLTSDFPNNQGYEGFDIGYESRIQGIIKTQPPYYDAADCIKFKVRETGTYLFSFVDETDIANTRMYFYFGSIPYSTEVEIYGHLSDDEYDGIYWGDIGIQREVELIADTYYLFFVDDANAGYVTDEYKYMFNLVPVVVPEIPAPPDSPIVTAINTTTLGIQWNSVFGSLAYSLWRSTSETGEYTKIHYGNTSYSDNDLQPNTTYYYKIKSGNEDATESDDITGWSDFSGISPGTTIDDKIVPQTPDILSVSVINGTNSDSINIIWNSVSNANLYNITRALSPSGPYISSYCGSATLFQDSIDLTPNTAYYYKVRAGSNLAVCGGDSASGWSQYSEYSSVTKYTFLDHIDITIDPVEITENSFGTINCIGYFDDGTNRDVTNEVTITIADEHITRGYLAGNILYANLIEGEMSDTFSRIDIRVAFQDVNEVKYFLKQITIIKSNTPPTVSITGPSSVMVGEQITLEGHVSNKSTNPSDYNWSSSDLSIASVHYNSGLVTGNTPGTVTISALNKELNYEYEGNASISQAEFTVTVFEDSTPALVLTRNPADGSVQCGEKITITPNHTQGLWQLYLNDQINEEPISLPSSYQMGYECGKTVEVYLVDSANPSNKSNTLSLTWDEQDETGLIRVNSVLPTTATLNQKTTFTVSGSNLTGGMGFWIANCVDLKEEEGNTTNRKFSCTPSELGDQPGVIKDGPGGLALKNFTVDVVAQIAAPVLATNPTSGTVTCGAEIVIAPSHTQGLWQLYLNDQKTGEPMSLQPSYPITKLCGETLAVYLVDPSNDSLRSNTINLTWYAPPVLSDNEAVQRSGRLPIVDIKRSNGDDNSIYCLQSNGVGDVYTDTGDWDALKLTVDAGEYSGIPADHWLYLTSPTGQTFWFDPYGGDYSMWKNIENPALADFLLTDIDSFPIPLPRELETGDYIYTLQVSWGEGDSYNFVEDNILLTVEDCLTPEIKIDEWDTPNPSDMDPISVDTNIHAGAYAGQLGEWAIIAETSDGNFCYDRDQNALVREGNCVYQFEIQDGQPIEDVKIPLTAGNYTFTLSVDNTPDGQIDNTWISSIAFRVHGGFYLLTEPEIDENCAGLNPCPDSTVFQRHAFRTYMLKWDSYLSTKMSQARNRYYRVEFDDKAFGVAIESLQTSTTLIFKDYTGIESLSPQNIASSVFQDLLLKGTQELSAALVHKVTKSDMAEMMTKEIFTTFQCILHAKDFYVNPVAVFETGACALGQLAGKYVELAQTYHKDTYVEQMNEYALARQYCYWFFGLGGKHSYVSKKFIGTDNEELNDATINEIARSNNISSSFFNLTAFNLGEVKKIINYVIDSVNDDLEIGQIQ